MHHHPQKMYQRSGTNQFAPDYISNYLFIITKIIQVCWNVILHSYGITCTLYYLELWPVLYKQLLVLFSDQGEVHCNKIKCMVLRLYLLPSEFTTGITDYQLHIYESSHFVAAVKTHWKLGHYSR